MLYRIIKIYARQRITVAAAVAVMVTPCVAVPSQAQLTDADPYVESSTTTPAPPVESASNTAALSPDGSLLANVDRSGDGISLWELRSGKRLRLLKGCRCDTYRLVFAPDGLTVASAGFECRKGNRMHLWDVRTGIMRTMFTGGMSGHLQVGYTRDGMVGAEEPGGWVRYWNAATGKPTRTEETGSALFTPDGRVFPRTRVINSLLTDANHPVGFFTLTPDGKELVRAAFAQPDRITRSEVTVWDAQTGKLLHRLPIYPYVHYLSAADPKHILVGGKDTAILWNPVTGAMKPLLTPEGQFGQRRSEIGVDWVQMSRTGTLAAWSAKKVGEGRTPGAKWHGQVSVWNTRSMTRIRTVQP